MCTRRSPPQSVAALHSNLDQLLPYLRRLEAFRVGHIYHYDRSQTKTRGNLSTGMLFMSLSWCWRGTQDHQDQGLPQPQDGPHYGLQAVPVGQQEVATPGWLAPDCRDHSRRQIQGRRKANRTRRLKPASPTFDNSSPVAPWRCLPGA